MKHIIQYCVLLAILFATSCTLLKFGKKTTALDELRAEISKTVTDQARKEKMLKAVDGMVVSIRELNALVDRERDQVNTLIRDYATTREKLETLLANSRIKKQRIIDDLTKAHSEFKLLTTEEEWKKLSKKEKKALAWVARDRSKGGE